MMKLLRLLDSNRLHFVNGTVTDGSASAIDGAGTSTAVSQLTTVARRPILEEPAYGGFLALAARTGDDRVNPVLPPEIVPLHLFRPVRSRGPGTGLANRHN
jgi:hypothetical protein